MGKWIEVIGMPLYSKKNSKVIAKKRILSSKRVREYEERMLPVYIAKRKEWKKQFDKADKPVQIEFYLIRPTKSKFDVLNMLQLPLDIMQTAEWIPDDDVYTVNPIFTGWEINKDKSKCGFKCRVK